MKLELNANEAQVLGNLIDLAVKSVGLQAAEAGIHFSKMLKTAADAEAAAPVADADDA